MDDSVDKHGRLLWLIVFAKLCLTLLNKEILYKQIVNFRFVPQVPYKLLNYTTTIWWKLAFRLVNKHTNLRFTGLEILFFIYKLLQDCL